MKKLFVLLVLITFVSFSQNAKKNEGEHRLLLIITNDKNNNDFINQMQLLNNNIEFEERKLKIIQVLPNFFKSTSDENWNTSSDLYQKFNTEKVDFKVVLIGLDGGLKLSQTKILSEEKLFKIIDTMPMRQRELRNKN